MINALHAGISGRAVINNRNLESVFVNHFNRAFAGRTVGKFFIKNIVGKPPRSAVLSGSSVTGFKKHFGSSVVVERVCNPHFNALFFNVRDPGSDEFCRRRFNQSGNV